MPSDGVRKDNPVLAGKLLHGADTAAHVEDGTLPLDPRSSVHQRAKDNPPDSTSSCISAPAPTFEQGEALRAHQIGNPYLAGKDPQHSAPGEAETVGARLPDEPQCLHCRWLRPAGPT